LPDQLGRIETLLADNGYQPHSIVFQAPDRTRAFCLTALLF
jgi:hypothetical protein